MSKPRHNKRVYEMKRKLTADEIKRINAIVKMCNIFAKENGLPLLKRIGKK